MPSPAVWRVGERCVDLDARAMVMGILNVTPDSFSDGGQHGSVGSAMDHALAMLDEGAEIIDVGGESTRPGAAQVEEAEEMKRVIPVIEAIRGAAEPATLISIDTCKPEVARRALEAGADIINDVTGFSQEGMVKVAAESDAGLVMMHMQGDPAGMQNRPHYDDVVREVGDYLSAQLAALVAAGVAAERVVVDPGIGFGKELAHNLSLLKNLKALRPQGRPLLLGVSRKSFIGRILQSDELEDRLAPTVALTAFCREGGAAIFRVHDVLPNVESLRMTEAILSAG